VPSKTRPGDPSSLTGMVESMKLREQVYAMGAVVETTSSEINTRTKINRNCPPKRPSWQSQRRMGAAFRPRLPRPAQRNNNAKGMSRARYSFRNSLNTAQVKSSLSSFLSVRCLGKRGKRRSPSQKTEKQRRYLPPDIQPKEFFPEGARPFPSALQSSILTWSFES